LIYWRVKFKTADLYGTALCKVEECDTVIESLLSQWTPVVQKKLWHYLRDEKQKVPLNVTAHSSRHPEHPSPFGANIGKELFLS
jgi:hypothetical protein